MMIFGMPPDDPEGLMPGAGGTIGFDDSDDSSAEMLDEADESMAPEAVRDPAPAQDDSA